MTKRLISLALAVLMLACVFVSCGEKADDGVIRIAIVQQLDHSSLDEIRIAIEAQLNALADELCREYLAQQEKAAREEEIKKQAIAEYLAQQEAEKKSAGSDNGSEN